jgi:hypothetical protein
MKLH